MADISFYEQLKHHFFAIHSFIDGSNKLLLFYAASPNEHTTFLKSENESNE